MWSDQIPIFIFSIHWLGLVWSYFLTGYFFNYNQQTHQKNQIKDSIDVDEPEGILLFPYDVLLYGTQIFFLPVWLSLLYLEGGDPLTAEELEEKERLLEEVSGTCFLLCLYNWLPYSNLIFGCVRDFLHGVGEISILLLELVRSMDEMI